MRIHLRYRNLWGELQKREMEILFQSDKRMICKYVIEKLSRPLFVNEVCVLENGYTAVSFIEYGTWYIMDKIFDHHAVSTGFLVKLATPVEENLTFLTTMDLFVRFWITPQNEFRTFGTKMFRKVSEDGLLSETVEKNARKTMNDLVFKIQNGQFPPEWVRDFNIDKKISNGMLTVSDADIDKFP